MPMTITLGGDVATVTGTRWACDEEATRGALQAATDGLQIGPWCGNPEVYAAHKMAGIFGGTVTSSPPPPSDDPPNTVY
jgi:hypothetical protein